MKTLKDAIINKRTNSKKEIIIPQDIRNNPNSMMSYNSEYISKSASDFKVPSHRVRKSYIQWNFKNNLLPKPKEKREAKVTDYLVMQRNKKPAESFDINFDKKLRGSHQTLFKEKRSSPMRNSMDVEKDAPSSMKSSPRSSSSLPKTNEVRINEAVIRNNKIAFARAQAKKTEEEIKQIELQMKYNRGTNVNDVVNMNAKLLGTIESKLQILSSIND